MGRRLNYLLPWRDHCRTWQLRVTGLGHVWIHGLTKDEFEQMVDAYVNHGIDRDDFEAFIKRWIDEDGGEYVRFHDVTADRGEQRWRYPEA